MRAVIHGTSHTERAYTEIKEDLRVNEKGQKRNKNDSDYPKTPGRPLVRVNLDSTAFGSYTTKQYIAL